MFSDSGTGAKASQVVFTAPRGAFYALELEFDHIAEDGYVTFLGSYDGQSLPLQPGNDPPALGTYAFRSLGYLAEGEEVEFGIAVPNPSTPPNSSVEWQFRFKASPVGFGPDLA